MPVVSLSTRHFNTTSTLIGVNAEVAAATGRAPGVGVSMSSGAAGYGTSPYGTGPYGDPNGPVTVASAQVATVTGDAADPTAGAGSGLSPMLAVHVIGRRPARRPSRAQFVLSAPVQV